jgi:hypothetical protein
VRGPRRDIGQRGGFSAQAVIAAILLLNRRKKALLFEKKKQKFLPIDVRFVAT